MEQGLDGLVDINLNEYLLIFSVEIEKLTTFH